MEAAEPGSVDLGHRRTCFGAPGTVSMSHTCTVSTAAVPPGAVSQAVGHTRDTVACVWSLESCGHFVLFCRET